MKVLIILIILFGFTYSKIKSKKQYVKVVDNTKEHFINCKQDKDKNLFFFKKTNISQHLNKINTVKERKYEYNPNNLISYNVSDYNNYDLVYQIGTKTSNRVLENQKKNFGIISSNKNILSKSFNKENEELIDKFNYKNFYKNSCINDNNNKEDDNNNKEDDSANSYNDTEINLLGRYNNKKLHLNWNIPKKLYINNIILNFKEKTNETYSKLVIPKKNNYFNFNIGKIEMYDSNNYLKYNLFFKENKEYNVFIELETSNSNILKSNVF
jgi:hypothetical protein